MLHGCFGIHYFNISGSKLQRLFIKVANAFQSISVENAPNLIEVSIILDKVVIGLEGDEVLRKFLDHLSNVEILRLNGKFIQVSTYRNHFFYFYMKARGRAIPRIVVALVHRTCPSSSCFYMI